MERVISVAPWTYLDLSCEEEERGKGDENDRKDVQITKLEQKEQA